jgi:hypothetical protein
MLKRRRHNGEIEDEARLRWENARPSVLHAPAFSPASPVLGWLIAWGAAIVAAAALQSAGVDLGLGLGIADGVDAVNTFGAGFWLAVIQAGAFLLGGYGAARIARRNGVRHALMVWVVAMAATGADAIVGAVRDRPQVIADLGLPYWHDAGLGAGGDAIVALGIFALVSLGGVAMGGVLGQGINLASRKRAEHDLRPVVETAIASSVAPSTGDEALDGRHVPAVEREDSAPVAEPARMPRDPDASAVGDRNDPAPVEESGPAETSHSGRSTTQHGFDLSREDKAR